MSIRDQCAAWFDSGKMTDWEKIQELTPPGLVLELGVAGGRSFNALCQLFPDRLCYGFDWFYGLPTAWKGPDCGDFSQQGRAPETEPNGCLVVGKIEDKIHRFIKTAAQKIALVNFDADLYDPTKVGLEAITAYLQPGTVLVFDEIHGEHCCIEHEQRAFVEWTESVRWGVRFLGNTHTWGAAFQVVEK